MQTLLRFYIPQWFSLGRSQFQRESNHLSDDRGCLTSWYINSPMNGPLVNDEDAHISESAEEEDLLGNPFKEEIKIALEMQSVHHLQKDGYN